MIQTSFDMRCTLLCYGIQLKVMCVITGSEMVWRWSLDSGGFTAIVLNGKKTIPTERYFVHMVRPQQPTRHMDSLKAVNQAVDRASRSGAALWKLDAEPRHLLCYDAESNPRLATAFRHVMVMLVRRAGCAFIALCMSRNCCEFQLRVSEVFAEYFHHH